MADAPRKTDMLGFVGLGVMGGHMARNLSTRFPVVVYDVEEARVRAQERADHAESLAEVGRRADLVLLSLPSSEIVRAVVAGPGGLADSLRKGSGIIDCSTTAPSVSRELAAMLGEKGIAFLDAPVSGGEGAARDASLAIMVGGREETLEAYRHVLEVVGGSIVRVGDTGAGGVAKLVNNMIVGAEFAVIAEGFALAKQNGLDPADLYEAIRGGWAGSRVLDVAATGIIERNFAPGGSIDILFKDIGYALQLARKDNVPVPVTAITDEVLKTARASGRGPYAQQIIIEMWELLLGLDGKRSG